MTAVETDLQVREALWPSAQPDPVREIRCRHCGRRNRVRVPLAVFSPELCTCGACSEPLFLPPDAPLTGLSPKSYEHDLDRKSLDALQSLPGFAAWVRWFVKTIGERTLRQTFMATHLHCNEDQFPEILAMMDRARARLDVPQRPTLFLSESPYMNAGTLGVDEPFIVVQAALLDQMDDDEVTAVLAHELGHIHAEHVLYRTLATLLLVAGSQLGGLSRLVTLPMELALLKWSRCAELTADRAGLLASRDLPATLRSELKFAGSARPGVSRRTRLRLAPFIAQARALAQMEESSWLDSVISVLLPLGQTHPFTAWRLLHLVRWVEQGNYLDILAGDYIRTQRKPVPE